jgi:hypothetical protein
MKSETLRHLRNGGSVRFEDGEELLFCSIGKAPTVEDLIAQGFLSPTGRRLSSPELQSLPRDSRAPARGGYWSQVLEKHRDCERQALARASNERRVRLTYQVLALLGWAAVVVMGVFYG